MKQRSSPSAMTDFYSAAALVTGGGTGIGRATSLALVREGVRSITISYATSAAEAERTAKELDSLGATVLVVRADVRSTGDITAMFDLAANKFGRLDILINNAGTTRYVDLKDLDGLTDEIWDLTLDTNLRGLFKCCRAAALMLKKSGGAIVNVASIAGLRGVGSSIAYSVSKAGVIQLTRVLAVALAPEVRVNCVVPGMVLTNWIERGGGGISTEEEAFRVAAATPLERVALAEDVADVILGLVRSKLVTGEEIVIDGGKGLTY
ncbi:SDR family oxidoreductase [Mesorhizobium sp. M1233]|uniref:SDR family NAD(P)-dependent oxidoreductase n=1 Tax=Mesorhizobium sp. M1233 TaxID=2957072 RepID=UPI00333DED8F